MFIFYQNALLFLLLYGAIAFVLLLFINAPYGKFVRSGWGPSLKAKWSWMIMELPSPTAMTILYFTSNSQSTLQLFFLACWLLHYIHRTFIYPFAMMGKNKPYPVLLILFAIIFNVLNGFTNGYEVFHINVYSGSWISTPNFIIGLPMFVAGFVINKRSDGILQHLKRKNPNDYCIPYGGMFKYISCPHYFGELIEWLGWAIMTWSFAGLVFFIFTFANLFPRAIASHSWYKKNFKTYPENRKAIIPFLI